MDMTPQAHSALVDALSVALGPERVLDRALDKHTRAHDASHYLLIPEVVAVAETIDHVADVLAVAAEHHIPVTFRSGGTSLAGQAVGSGILVDTRRGFRAVEVLDGGARVRAQPGVTVRTVNARLAKYGTALGPDPASEAACTVGGVIANNSSGMAAGIEHNCTRTVESMIVVLPSGTVVDTAHPQALEQLRHAEPELVAGLETLTQNVKDDSSMAEEIQERFALKNTMGYSLDAFCDAEDTLELFMKLLIGSEGTLGFVAEATFRTVPVQPEAATGLLVFDSVERAAEHLPALINSGAAALELMDAASLRVARRGAEVPETITGFDLHRQAALLIEYRADDAVGLQQRLQQAHEVLSGLVTERPVELTSDPGQRAALWSVRKGLYAAVAGARPRGTTALLEDVVVPVGRLAQACRELAELLEHHGYTDPVIFGHAKDGNLHFMLTEDTEDPASVQRLDVFTREMVKLILNHRGNLKAEHGTGRAMAPFIDHQYSPAVVEILRGVKEAFDPGRVLNPGVVLTEDPDAHLHHLKPVERIDAEVDGCVECGYCEPVCPSRHLTLTPRQRIVARRARVRAAAQGNNALVQELDEQQDYDSLQTCAADGICATACPVGIDTGALVKRLRRESHGAVSQQIWKTAARHWDGMTRFAAGALTAAAKLPSSPLEAANRAARTVGGQDAVPMWSRDLPAGGTRRGGAAPAERPNGPTAFFVPSCQGAMFAAADGSQGVQTALQQLCQKAGIQLRIPEGIDGLCCGTPWSSKGFSAGYEVMSERVLAQIGALSPLQKSDSGRDTPVIVDATSCTEGVAEIMAQAQLRGDPRAASVVDAVTFVLECVLPRLDLSGAEPVESLTLHPTCSSQKLGTTGQLRQLAEAIALQVHVPETWGCCGFAGDRGMLHPELTAAATADEADDVRGVETAEYASCNRACEIAMTRATGRSYRHVVEVAADVLGV